MRTLSLDFETFAHRDIRKVGTFQYVRCNHFAVTVIAWAFDDEPVNSVVWPLTKALPEEVLWHIEAGGRVQAWNAAFEATILRDHYKLATLTDEQLSCTMQRALVDGLPGSLENAGAALKLSIVKDRTAHGLMLRMSKPKRDGTAWHETDAAKLKALEAYCRRDVEAEREVGLHVPELTSFEKQVSELDARSNRAGVQLDDRAIGLLLKAREHIRREQAAEVRGLTGGYVTRIESETAKLLNWLHREGAPLASVDKADVAATLTRPTISSHVRRVLELRQEAAKSSLGKIDRMLAVRAGDGRARGLLQFYGAGRTGRWAGRLVQVQNLPRNVAGVDPEEVLGVLTRDAGALGLFHERPLDALSACLRGCITAAPGKLLAMIDLAQIEARVLAWLAGQQDVLEVFGRGDDVYVHEAAKQGSADRQFGKVLVLACGYGMGGTKFQATAEGYGLALTESEARRAVAQWRAANREVVKFWYAMEEAARACVARPGLHETVRGVRLVVRWGKLHVRKPGGGVLVYHNPRLADGELVFDGVSQTTKQWGEQKTYGGKLVENVTQAVARDLVAEAMVRVWEHYRLVPVMTVHDELVYEVDPASPVEADAIKALVDQAPAWAGGLPLASKLAVGFRYGK